MGLLGPLRRRGALLAVLGSAAACSPIQLAAPLTAVEAGPAPAAPLEIAWEHNVEGAVGPDAPLVTTEFAALGTRRGDVVVVGLRDGRLEGSTGFDQSVEGGLALAPDGRTLFVPLARAREGVVAHDLVAGRRAWRADLGPVEAAPVLVGGVVVAGTLDGTVAGLDADTGRALWSRRPDTLAAIHASPIALNDDALVADDRGHVYRLGAASGEVVWTADLGEPVYNRAARAGGHVVVPTTRGTLVALDPATGETVWRAALGDRVRVGPPLALGDLVVVGTTAGAVVALDASTGRVRWQRRVEGAVSARPAAGPGVVYVGTQAGRLVALAVADGAPVWETTLRGRVKTDLAVAGDLLLVAAEPRHLVALRSSRPDR